MAHWGWYWKIKLNHKRKRLCHWHIAIDSFKMFRKKVLVDLFMGKTAYEIPEYGFKATLFEDRYDVQYNDGSYSIPIEKQICNYGGFRYFFHCPQCDRRMRILYCDKGRFLCRKCLKLGYATQILTPSHRCLSMTSKIKGKLGSMGGSLEKRPPWMKKKTFKRLQDKHYEYIEHKFTDAVRKELLEYYPHKHEEINRLI